MLNWHAIQEPKNGCTFKTALTIDYTICMFMAGGGCKVAVYLRRHSAVKPDGWAYIIGRPVPWMCTTKPMVVKL